MIHTNSKQLLKDISEKEGKIVRYSEPLNNNNNKTNSGHLCPSEGPCQASAMSNCSMQELKDHNNNEFEHELNIEKALKKLEEQEKYDLEHVSEKVINHSQDEEAKNSCHNSSKLNANERLFIDQQAKHIKTSSAHQNEKLDEDDVRSVIVTGCGSKIGRKIATAFARLDFNVALVDFDIKQTQSVAHECQLASPKNRLPLQIIADISQLDEAHKVIDQAVKQFNRLDVLVNTINNAALMKAHFSSGQADDDPHVFEQYHRIIANNMHSVTYLCISAAPHLRKSKGSIVNVSSISKNDHGSYKFAYCMSKAGILTLTKCLATDFAPDIQMICVSDRNLMAAESADYAQFCRLHFP